MTHLAPAGAGDAAGVHAAVASDRPLAGSDRGLLAYGRRLHGASEAATMPAGRGILAYGRKLHAADLMPTQGLHEEGVSIYRSRCIAYTLAFGR